MGLLRVRRRLSIEPDHWGIMRRRSRRGVVRQNRRASHSAATAANSVRGGAERGSHVATGVHVDRVAEAWGARVVERRWAQHVPASVFGGQTGAQCANLVIHTN